MFEQSLREAVQRGDGYIAVGDDEGGAHRTLAALNVDSESLADLL